MVKNKCSSKKETKKQTPIAIEDRERRIMNSMVNTSVILMSTLMGAFSQLIVNATGSMASGMAEAFGGKEAGDKTQEEVEQKLPEVDEKMKEMLSDLRKEMYDKLNQKRPEFKRLLSDKIYDVGPKIIERYDFNLPKLTQELDDEALAQYSLLVARENPRFTEMFKELTEWMNSLPISSKDS